MEVDKIIGSYVIGFVTLILLGLILSYPAMLLWNGCLVPAVGVNEITWLQSWGLQFLSGMFFSRVNLGK